MAGLPPKPDADAPGSSCVACRSGGLVAASARGPAAGRDRADRCARGYGGPRRRQVRRPFRPIASRRASSPHRHRRSPPLWAYAASPARRGRRSSAAMWRASRGSSSSSNTSSVAPGRGLISNSQNVSPSSMKSALARPRTPSAQRQRRELFEPSRRRRRRRSAPRRRRSGKARSGVGAVHCSLQAIGVSAERIAHEQQRNRRVPRPGAANIRRPDAAPGLRGVYAARRSRRAA